MTPLETIEALSTEQISVVASTSGNAELTQVMEAAGFRWLVNGGSSVQSLVSVDSPATLLLPNHVAMLFSLLLIDDVDSILSLGMGGGSFERFLCKQYPSSTIVSVEPNKDIIRLAREFFGIPASVQIDYSNAEDFVCKTDQRFDLVLCDIFERENHPACLTNKSFYQDIKSKLRLGGVLAMNTTPASDEAMLDILQSLRESFSIVYLAAIQMRGNVIVVAKNGNADSVTDSVDYSIDAIRSRAEVLSSNVGVSLCEWVDAFKLIPAPDRVTVANVSRSDS